MNIIERKKRAMELRNKLREKNKKKAELIKPFQHKNGCCSVGKNAYEIFYQKEPKFGFSVPNTVNKRDYTEVIAIYADSLDQVFFHMQGEIWSPNGEARDLIRLLELHHTSMSVGDVICKCNQQIFGEDEYFIVAVDGFKPIEFI